MKKILQALMFYVVSISLHAGPPDPPAGKVWILNPLMSDEFGPQGANPDVFNVYTKDRSWGRTAAFDPKAIRAEQDPDNDSNYFLTMNPIWYYEDEVWHSDKLDRTFTFAGGALDTKNLQTYGYFEVCIRPSDFPMGSGVFMNSRQITATECLDKYSTELDLIENMGYTGPGAGEKDDRGGFFNYVQHVNSHTKDLKYIDNDGNCVPYEGWDAWDSRGADHYTLEDPHAFFTVGMWWENATTAHFYNNDRLFSTVTPARDFKIPMALILSMETYITAGKEENNAGNPKPEEWMWEDDFRTRDQRAVKYDWVRTWKLVDVNPDDFNEDKDNIEVYEANQNAYLGENINATLIYSACKNQFVTAQLLSPTNEVIDDTTISVNQGVRSLSLEFSTASITDGSDNYTLKYSIEDEGTVVFTNSVQISFTEKPLTKILYKESFPTSLEPASSINLDVAYEADTVCKLVVEVHKPNGDGLSWDSQIVQAGKGTMKFNINLSSPLEYGTDYYFRVYMFRNGMNWQDPQAVNLGNLFFNVEDPWEATIEILEVDSVFTDDETIGIEFSYATKTDGDLSILLLDKDDNIVASEYRKERYGNRIISRKMDVESTLSTDDQYKAIITYISEIEEFEMVSDTISNIMIHKASVDISIGENDFIKEDFSICPNPSSGIVYIKFNQSRELIKSVEVVDITGSLFLRNTIGINSSTFEIDMSTYVNGTYIIRLSTEDNVYTKKIVKK
ncbi:T9SS type A sorting domain-containing protein [Saccharicrinis sp. GN24d3]|uniref:T9SS type A sorting domain-containing protein n=1 Tax=Saccharicrinis sp. GN24d3 TaxID=3458416 RepID=UPI00403549B6